jgi:hypothetical protein
LFNGIEKSSSGGDAAKEHQNRCRGNLVPLAGGTGMKALFSSAAALMLVASLPGCATYADQGRAEVTRFHSGQPIPRGRIAIEAFNPVYAGSPAFQQDAVAVANHLSRLGWTVVPSAEADQIAIVDIRQGSRAAYSRSPLTIGIGGFTGGWRSSVGAGASFPLGGGARELVGTMLEVRIRRRGEGTTLWEGRAWEEAPGDPGFAVGRLAEVLFRDFPGESGRTIRLR